MKKVALITGASRGIGKEIAKYFATKSHYLILLARNEEKLEDVAKTLRHTSKVDVEILPIDIRNHDEVRNSISTAIETAGRLDVLVNAAGIFRYGTSALTMNDLDDLLETNVKAVHNLCSICSDSLKASDNAHIFNISSVVGLTGFAPIGGYSASKFALVGYGQSLAKELLDAGVNVTTICPDVVDTEMSASSGMPAENMISREDVVRAVDFVMSLSPSAIVDQLTIKCRKLEEFMNVRK